MENKTTLCLCLNYKYICQAEGKCEYCEYYVENGGVCPGCGANFESKPNPNAKYELTTDDDN